MGGGEKREGGREREREEGRARGRESITILLHVCLSVCARGM